ncbi:MAG: FAD-dependent oxidoreductase [Firmicutes bacterium]|nr:FAD-dependent oxidoreductase [Bacillota bacterium]
MTYDLIIIGAGPAGMTAGVFAARKGLKTLIVSKDIGGQVNWTTDIENYMGFQEIDGPALMAKFENQVKENHLTVKLAEVRSLRKEGCIFTIQTASSEELFASSVIIASGKRPKTLNVPGEIEFRNKGVSYCATCDGPLFRNLPLAVIGGGNSAAKSILELHHYTQDLFWVANQGITADAVLAERVGKLQKIQKYLEHNVVAILGAKFVEKIRIEKNTTKEITEIPVQGIFIEIGLEPNVDFIGKNVAKSAASEIKIDCLCRTNIPGLYAAGDVSSVPEKQIIVAAGEGAKAALQAWEDLINLPGGPAPSRPN